MGKDMPKRRHTVEEVINRFKEKEAKVVITGGGTVV